MKKINLKFPFKFLIIPFVSVIAIALILSLIFGFRLGTEFIGGKRVSVNITGQTNVGAIRSKTIKTLNYNGLSVENVSVQDSEGNSYLVFITENNKNVDFEEVRNRISTNAEVDLASVGEFETISSSLPKNAVLFSILSFVLILGIVFVAGVVRYKLAGGGMLAIGIIATILTHLSLLAITRIVVGIAVLVSVVVGAMLSSVILIAILENVRSKQKLNVADQTSDDEAVSEGANSVLVPILSFCAFVLVFALILIFTSLPSTRAIGFSLIYGVISSIYVGFLVTLSLYPIFLEIANIRAKLKTTKNPNYKKKK